MQHSFRLPVHGEIGSRRPSHSNMALIHQVARAGRITVPTLTRIAAQLLREGMSQDALEAELKARLRARPGVARDTFIEGEKHAPGT